MVKKISIPYHIDNRLTGLIWMESTCKISRQEIKNIFYDHGRWICSSINEGDYMGEGMYVVDKKHPKHNIKITFEEIEKGVLSEKIIRLNWRQMDWDLPF